jgi:glycosyltransferase involved in cell wall biosynthesis
MAQISVITPTYNRAHLLGRAVQSVLGQTFRDFELIVVDDGSTDNTQEVVANMGDERLRYIRHERNRGASAARNTGIRAARGAYIAFQDSDDEWMPDKLEKQIRAFENASSALGVVYTGFWRIEGDKRTYIPSSQIEPKDGNVHSVLLKTNFIAPPEVLIKRECFEKAGMFDEELHMLEDWELWIRLSKYYQFKCLNEPLVRSYYTSGSVNAQRYRIQARARKLILKKHYEDMKRDRGLLSRLKLMISKICYQILAG